MSHITKAEILAKITSDGPIALQFIDTDTGESHFIDSIDFIKELIVERLIVCVCGASGQLDKFRLITAEDIVLLEQADAVAEAIAIETAEEIASQGSPAQ